MSLLETMMLIGLGFAVAALAGLFAGRILWKVALRAGARRIQRQVPVTVTELQADRDRMRAEYAMLSRKRELELGSLKMRLAESSAEVMRHRNRIELLSADLGRGAHVSSSLDLEIQRLRQRMGPLEAELASRTASYQQLRDEQRQKDEAIASLTAEIARRDRPNPQDRLADRIDALTALSQQIADQRARFARDRDVLAGLQKTLAAPLAEDIVAEPKLEEIASNGRKIEDNLRAAESETGALVREMRELDAAVSRKVEELEQLRQDSAMPGETPQRMPPAGSNAAPRARAIGNVVTLATRLRPQKDIQG